MERPEGLRRPAVAGHFYPASPRELAAEVRKHLDPSAPKFEALACVLPHAGYTYSGAVAGATVSRLRPRGTVFLLGPNHTGYGMPFSVMPGGVWETPLGRVAVNRELAAGLAEGSEIFSLDETAHLREHSLEVELPFLQETMGRFSIVPVVVGADDPAELKEAGEQIGCQILKHKLQGCALVAASSDLTHYESRDSAREKDRLAIEAMLEMNADKLLRVVRQKNISMCGVAPVCVMLAAAKMLGAAKAELVKYQTSGDVTGDFSSVVGYAGIIFY